MKQKFWLTVFIIEILLLGMFGDAPKASAGFFDKCNKENIDGEVCIVCTRGSEGVAVWCK